MAGQRRRAFTLVELLIVMVVIGVLSTMMMAASNEMVTSAKAAKIVNDLNQLKKAVLGWYLGNFERFNISTNGFKVDGKTEVHEFLSQAAHSPEVKDFISSNNFSLNEGKKNYTTDLYAKEGGFSIYMGYQNTRCYVVYKISDNAQAQTRLKEKLKGRAKSAGLISYNKDRPAKDGDKAIPYDGGNMVLMEVFRLSN